MQIDKNIIIQLGQVPWFENCGKDLPSDLGHLELILSDKQAQILFFSDEWADVKTEAQGDLTGYLSKYHYNSYGGYWNNLGKDAARLIEGIVQKPLSEAIDHRGWQKDMVKSIILDLTRAVLEYSYRAKFRKIPLFFCIILEVYKAGHLPCGWSGGISQWPKGVIIAH